MTHRELVDSAAAYAMGTLEGDERKEFESHLPGCVHCQEEVDAYREAAGLLVHVTPTVTPPNSAALRERILHEARRVRPITAARSRQPSGTRAPWLAAAACLTLAIASGYLYWMQQRANSAVLTELATARTELAARDSTIASFLGPEVHVVSLAQSNAKPAMRVFWNHTRKVFIVTAFALPAAPEGKTYQLWAIAEGKAPVSMGTFDTDENGRATVILPVGQDITEAGFIDLCGLTLEPESGSAQPTESPRLIGPWRHVD
jgi:anti-sigma-K factor RskA